MFFKLVFFFLVRAVCNFCLLCVWWEILSRPCVFSKRGLLFERLRWARLILIHWNADMLWLINMWMNKRWWSRDTGVPRGVRRLAPKSSWIKPWFPPSPCLKVSVAGFTLSPGGVLHLITVGEIRINVCSESILTSPNQASIVYSDITQSWSRWMFYSKIWTGKSHETITNICGFHDLCCGHGNQHFRSS